MTREQAIKEIEQAGAKPVVSQFIKFTFDGTHVHTFFPNHYDNMRRGEVLTHVQKVKEERLGRRKPRSL